VFPGGKNTLTNTFSLGGTMSKSYDDELPGATLPGAKIVANFVDGRYVPVPDPGPLRIPSRQVVVVDPKAIAEFRNEPGPPSIVDVILARPIATNRYD